MEFRIQQETTQRSTEWWQWSVWVDGDKSALDQIDSVEYILHPTFAEPIHRVRNRRTKFRLNASGWDEFMLHIHIHQQDGSIQKLDHWLRFENPAQPSAMAIPTKSADMVAHATCFFSYSLADAELVAKVGALLGGTSIITADDSDPNIPTKDGLRQLVRTANFGVIILTDVRISPFMSAEANALIQSGIPTLFVRIGPQTEVPREFADYQALQIKDRSDTPEIAARIRQWIESGPVLPSVTQHTYKP